jgi:hypothetical protein
MKKEHLILGAIIIVALFVYNRFLSPMLSKMTAKTTV